MDGVTIEVKATSILKQAAVLLEESGVTWYLQLFGHCVTLACIGSSARPNVTLLEHEVIKPVHKILEEIVSLYGLK